MGCGVGGVGVGRGEAGEPRLSQVVGGCGVVSVRGVKSCRRGLRDQGVGSTGWGGGGGRGEVTELRPGAGGAGRGNRSSIVEKKGCAHVREMRVVCRAWSAHRRVAVETGCTKKADGGGEIVVGGSPCGGGGGPFDAGEWCWLGGGVGGLAEMRLSCACTWPRAVLGNGGGGGGSVGGAV